MNPLEGDIKIPAGVKVKIEIITETTSTMLVNYKSPVESVLIYSIVSLSDFQLTEVDVNEKQ